MSHTLNQTFFYHFFVLRFATQRRSCQFLLVLIGLFGGWEPLWAGVAQVERSWFTDTTGTMSFEQVQQQEFIRYDNILSRGFKAPSEILWIRLAITINDSGKRRKLALRITPPMLDHIGLYDPQEGIYGEIRVGDTQPHDEDVYFSPNHTLFIDNVESQRTLWLRVETTSPQIIAVEILTFKELIRADSKQQLIFFSYLAAEWVFIIWGWLQWLNMRDELLLTFVLKQSLLMFYALGNMGYLQLIWPFGAEISGDKVFKMIIIASIAISFRFDYLFFRGFKPNRFLHKLLCLASLLFPIQYLLLAMGMDQYMARMNILLAMSAPLISLMVAITSRSYAFESGKILISRRTVITVYALLTVTFFSTALNLLGVIDPTIVVFNGFLSYAFLWGIIFILILNKRIKLIREENQNLVLSIQNAEQKAELERKARIEKNHFLEMLTHELKTPLSVVQMVLGSKNISHDMKNEAQNSIYEMSRVISYVQQVEKMDEHYIDIHNEQVELNTLLEDCVNTVKSDFVKFEKKSEIYIQSDPHILHTIITNLLDNALKYGKAASAVTLDYKIKKSNDSRTLAISICNLPGLSGWPNPERLFEKYYRENASQHYTGSGLGLYLSAGLAALINGKLTYQPTDTQICFELEIDLSSSVAKDTETKPKT